MCLLTVSLNSIHIYIWESAIPGAIVQQMGYTLDRLPACRKSCTFVFMTIQNSHGINLLVFDSYFTFSE